MNNIIIELKDDKIIKIDSCMSIETVYDFYSDITVPVQYIKFLFESSLKKAYSLDQDMSHFISVVGFFYGKDFKSMTRDEFIAEFERYFMPEEINYNNVWYVIIRLKLYRINQHLHSICKCWFVLCKVAQKHKWKFVQYFYAWLLDF